MAEKTISIKSIADRLLRHPLMSELTLETILDYAIDFQRVVGIPRAFEEKIELIPIENYRGLLPCDWYQTIQIREKKKAGHYMPALRYSSDNFHLKPHRQHGFHDHTFKIQGNIIYTSFKDGEIEMSYLAIPLDSDGLPLIPDNSKYMRALEYYIRKEFFTILFDQAKITLAVLQNAQQQYAFYVGQAQNDLIKLDLSKAESLFNGWSSLLPKDHTFQQGFVHDGAKEHIRIQR
jgi:hypothetical protein